MKGLVAADQVATSTSEQFPERERQKGKVTEGNDELIIFTNFTTFKETHYTFFETQYVCSKTTEIVHAFFQIQAIRISFQEYTENTFMIILFAFARAVPRSGNAALPYPCPYFFYLF